MAVIQTFNFSSSTGWTLDSGMVWEIGTPTQVTAYDGDCLATDLTANYPDSISTVSYATSPVIDCSSYESVTISFRRNAAFENNTDYDTFTVQVYDGTTWQTVWTSDDTTADISDSSWTLQEPSISTYGDENANFRVRFSGESDGSTNFRGWFIDDLIISGTATTNYQIDGITYDVDGDILGTCKVALFKDNTPTDSFSFVDYTTSNATTGAYNFSNLADNDANYCVRAWKDDTPHVFDVTDYEILPKETTDVSYDLYLRSDADKSETSPDKDLRLRTQEAKTGISVSSVGGDSDIRDDATDIVILGNKFGASETGSAKVEFGDAATYAGCTYTPDQSVDTWADGSITIDDVTMGSLSLGQNYCYVTDSTGEQSSGHSLVIYKHHAISSVSVTGIYNGKTGIEINGSEFYATQNSSKVYLCDTADGSGTNVEQTVTNWADGKVTITVVAGALSLGSAYLIVARYQASLGDLAERYSNGSPVTLLGPPSFVMSLSSSFTNKTATTEQLTSPAAGTFKAGQILESSNPGDENSLTAKQYTEYEFCIEATTDSDTGGEYEFRIVDGYQSGEQLEEYTKVPKVTLAT